LDKVFDNHNNKNSCPLFSPATQEQHVALLDAKQWCSQHVYKLGRNSVASLMVLLPGRGYASKPHLYQCLYCQKVFATRYYLDLYFQTHHSNVTTTNNNTTLTSNDDDNAMIFPATDWCRFLNCQEWTLELEPYYGPGSEGGWDRDQHKMEAQLWTQAHDVPCTHDSVEHAQEACQQMVDSCFAVPQQQKLLSQFLHAQVCHQLLSCPDRFHKLFFAAGHVAVRFMNGKMNGCIGAIRPRRLISLWCCFFWVPFMVICFGNNHPRPSTTKTTRHQPDYCNHQQQQTIFPAFCSGENNRNNSNDGNIFFQRANNTKVYYLSEKSIDVLFFKH
jgi:hypothetical protein